MDPMAVSVAPVLIGAVTLSTCVFMVTTTRYTLKRKKEARKYKNKIITSFFRLNTFLNCTVGYGKVWSGRDSGFMTWFLSMSTGNQRAFVVPTPRLLKTPLLAFLNLVIVDSRTGVVDERKKRESGGHCKRYLSLGGDTGDQSS